MPVALLSPAVRRRAARDKELPSIVPRILLCGANLLFLNARFLSSVSTYIHAYKPLTHVRSDLQNSRVLDNRSTRGHIIGVCLHCLHRLERSVFSRLLRSDFSLRAVVSVSNTKAVSYDWILSACTTWTLFQLSNWTTKFYCSNLLENLQNSNRFYLCIY